MFRQRCKLLKRYKRNPNLFLTLFRFVHQWGCVIVIHHGEAKIVQSTIINIKICIFIIIHYHLQQVCPLSYFPIDKYFLFLSYRSCFTHCFCWYSNNHLSFIYSMPHHILSISVRFFFYISSKKYFFKLFSEVKAVVPVKNLMN